MTDEQLIAQQARRIADLEAALECGDRQTEREANAWLVARAALKTPNAPAQRRP